MSIPPPPPPGWSNEPGWSGDPGWTNQSWGAQPGYPPQREHPSGTTVLILGILSVTFCQILGPVAWIMGSRVQSEIDRSPGFYHNRGNVVAGRICGIIGTAILAVYVLVIVAIVAVAITSPR